MVITYGKKRLGPIMKYLEDRDIPTRVEGDVPFGENEALKEIYKIYSAVADADDRIALYGALTGKLIGLSGDDMLSFISNGGTISIKSSFDADQCTDDTAKLVASKIEELKILHIMAKRLSPAALFVNIMESYMVYETVEAENLEVVYYTLELLRSRERSGIVVSLKDGASYIAGLIAGNTDEERCLSLDTSRDAVHMANLHKVKGLEAPIVILAATTAFYNPNDKRIVHGDNGSEGYIFQLPRKDDDGNTRGSHFKTDAYADRLAEEKAASIAENDRLIYVAATRARNVLIICDSIKNSFGKEKHQSVWSPVMKPDIPDLFDTLTANSAAAAVQREKTDPADLYRQASNGCVLADRGAEEATYVVENPSHLHISSKVSEEPQTGIPETVSEVHRFPALLGTMTHKLMEVLVSSHNRTDAAAVVDEIIREYRTSETQPYEKELAKSLSDVAQKMRSGGYEQKNGLPQDILSVLMGADDVMCEVPFCYREDCPVGYKLWNGVMDVVYHENGKWHIVDYKTNADGSDLDSRYAGQLEAYVKAFRAVTGEEADAATYHIDI